jgi:hypothetical protein
MRASDEALSRELPRLQAELSAQMLVVAEQSRRQVAQLDSAKPDADAPGRAPGPEPTG